MPSGSWSRIASIRWRASDAAIAMLRLQSVKNTRKSAPSARAVPSVRLMPDMVDKASSTGRNTVRSTSSGVDPVYGRLTKISGGVTDGKASSGSRTAAIRPITNSDTKNMIVVTGRRMLSSAMLMGDPSPLKSHVRLSVSCLAPIDQWRLLTADDGDDFRMFTTGATAAFAVVLIRTPVEQVVHHRNYDQRQQCGHQQSTNDGDRHRRAHLGTLADR